MYNSSEEQLTAIPETTLHWLGGVSPPDVPFCGFRNDNPICVASQLVNQDNFAIYFLSYAVLLLHCDRILLISDRTCDREEWGRSKFFIHVHDADGMDLFFVSLCQKPSRFTRWSPLWSSSSSSWPSPSPSSSTGESWHSWPWKPSPIETNVFTEKLVKLLIKTGNMKLFNELISVSEILFLNTEKKRISLLYTNHWQPCPLLEKDCTALQWSMWFCSLLISPAGGWSWRRSWWLSSGGFPGTTSIWVTSTRCCAAAAGSHCHWSAPCPPQLRNLSSVMAVVVVSCV